MNDPQIIWRDESGQGRNVFALFLNRFTIEEIPLSCPLHLFADSLYRLRVNGQIVSFGPARFLPSHPQYDTHDLAPWLRLGKNTVLVEVNSRGAPCFQAVINRGGLIAWGGARFKSGLSIDFSTPGRWLVCPTEAWESRAEPFSFAQGPVEIHDLTGLPLGYPDFGDRIESSDWRHPVLQAQPKLWGEFTSRAIPLPSMKVTLPKTIIVAASLKNDYLRCGFNTGNEEEGIRQPFFLHVFSPVEQAVELGLFWGPIFLNGIELISEDCKLRGNRKNARAHLRQGWNFVYGQPDLLKPCWTWLMELPNSVGLKMGALPTMDCRYAFGLGPPKALSPMQLKSAPASLAELPNYPDHWHFVTQDVNTCSPARELAWDMIDKVWIDHRVFGSGIHLPCYGEACTVVLDMGEEYLGHFLIEFETENGATLDIGYDERTEASGKLAYFQSNPFLNTADRFIFGKGRQELMTFHERGGRFLQLTFRRHPGRVHLCRVELISTTAAHQVTGEVETNDRLFNWIWQTGQKTVQTCMADGWVDCPWRERGMYLGDVLVMARASRKFTGEWRLEPWAIRLWAHGQFANGQLPDVAPSAHDIPLCDYTLLWIEILRDYWAATGDVELVAEVWPTLHRILKSSVWKPAESGLWEAHDDCVLFVDWGATDEEKKGTNGVLNAFRIRALDCAAEMALGLGRRREHDSFAAQADEVREAFRRELWDERTGRFAACIRDGQRSTGPSLHVNALALAYGLAKQPQERSILEYLKTGLAENAEFEEGYLELYFLHFVMEGLYRVNESGLAEQVIREHYGLMRSRGAWTFWETLKSGLSQRDSLCHGWSACPLIYFSERILGVRVNEAGDPSQMLIAPESDSLQFASGSVPHPLGLIQVSWRIDGLNLFLSVKAPHGVTTHIQPQGRLANLHLILNGEEKSAGAAEDEPTMAMPRFSI